MIKKSTANDYNSFDVFSEADEPERFLGRTTWPWYHKAMEPSVEDAANMHARKGTFGKQELWQQAAGSVNQPETIDTSRFMNVDHVALCDLGNA